MEVDLAAILPAIGDTVKPRRAPARLPASLARRLAIFWCIKRVFVPSRRRRPIDWPYRGAVSLDRDDPALDSNSDQDESSISAPVVWPALRCAELDCFTGYRPVIGRVVSAEHPNQEKHEHPHNEHAYKNILATGARQRDPPAVAMKERHAKLVFKQVNALGHV